MIVCKVSHFFLSVAHGVPVNRFQNGICLPATLLHDIGIRDTQSVTDGCRIVPEVMETEM